MAKEITRREFLKRCGIACAALAGSEILSGPPVFGEKTGIRPHPASFYKQLDETTVQCELCARGCTLQDGQRSFCRVREPKGGKLFTYAYGSVCAAHVDPVEKKPLFHFLPGTEIYSIATAGCNYRCRYCQNWQISQYTPEEVDNIELPPEKIAQEAKRHGCPTVAFTYTEPSIFYEYMLDSARLIKAAGLRTMYHSNGSLNRKPVEEIALHLDAADIDLKAFNQEFYEKTCAGYLDTVLTALKVLKQNGVWLELTNLVVPTLNDDIQEISRMCAWITENLGPDVPIHFSRFWPQYKLAGLYPTPEETLEKARAAAIAAGMRYVYLGNLAGSDAEHTYCPKCRKALIKRRGYTILERHLEGGACGYCGEKIAGVWS